MRRCLNIEQDNVADVVNNKGCQKKFVFEVEYLFNSSAKKDGVNTNLILYDSSKFRTPLILLAVLV